MRRPECMKQKFGQTQMAAVWKECTRMENAGKRKWVCSLFFVFLLLMGISFTALAAPQAGYEERQHGGCFCGHKAAGRRISPCAEIFECIAELFEPDSE